MVKEICVDTLDFSPIELFVHACTVDHCRVFVLQIIALNLMCAAAYLCYFKLFHNIRSLVPDALEVMSEFRLNAC